MPKGYKEGHYDFEGNGMQLHTPRVWDNVVKGTADECWAWKRFHHPITHHPMMGIKLHGRRIMTYVHRVLWLLCHGPIPEGHHVVHRCMNARCVNPDHLETMTRNEAGRRSGKQSRKPKIKRVDLEKTRWQALQDKMAEELKQAFGFKGNT